MNDDKLYIKYRNTLNLLQSVLRHLNYAECMTVLCHRKCCVVLKKYFNI